jgi:hypothetical protein
MKNQQHPLLKLEKFILSVKYLPTILYFGSIGLIIYNFEVEFLNDYTENLLIIIWCYLNYLGVKEYEKKRKNKS